MKKINCFIGIGLLATSAAFAESSNLSAFERNFSEDLSGAYAQNIMQIASTSSCAKYSWKKRGNAPIGYTKGVALMYARSICRLRANSSTNTAARVMSMANTGRDSIDALSHYAGIFQDLNMPINVAGENTLRALYALGLGLGMRESSGAYCEGWDTSAGSKRPSAAGEAGLFQSSYDSIGKHPDLRHLYDEYRSNSDRCMLDVFKEKASCRPQGLLGTGAGADFQAFNKACPAFATEYAMTLLRVNRSHYGPINRREAEVKAICNNMLANVQTLVDSNPQAACQELF